MKFENRNKMFNGKLHFLLVITHNDNIGHINTLTPYPLSN